MTENCGWTQHNVYFQHTCNYVSTSLCLTFLLFHFLNWIEDVKLIAISRANLVITHVSPWILYQCFKCPKTPACCQCKEQTRKHFEPKQKHCHCWRSSVTYQSLVDCSSDLYSTQEKSSKITQIRRLQIQHADVQTATARNLRSDREAVGQGNCALCGFAVNGKMAP